MPEETIYLHFINTRFGGIFSTIKYYLVYYFTPNKAIKPLSCKGFMGVKKRKKIIQFKEKQRLELHLNDFSRSYFTKNAGARNEFHKQEVQEKKFLE